MDLLHLVTTRADRFLSFVPGAQAGHPRDTHQARVAARRLAEVLALTGDRGRRLDRDVRTLRRAVGAAREVDVASIIFEQAVLEHRWPRDAVRRVRRHLAAERERRREDVSDTLEDVSLSRLRRRIREVGEYAAGVPVKKLAARVRTRVHVRDDELADAIERAGSLYDIDKLHDVRLAVKKLRYTLEVARDAIGGRWTARINALRRQQELLGELHDLQVLVRYIRDLEISLAGEPGPLARALTRIRRDIDADSRQLHGTWLKKPK